MIKVYGLDVEPSKWHPQRSVISDLERSPSGNTVVRIGRENNAGWYQTEHVVLTPDEVELFVEDLGRTSDNVFVRLPEASIGGYGRVLEDDSEKMLLERLTSKSESIAAKRQELAVEMARFKLVEKAIQDRRDGRDAEDEARSVRITTPRHPAEDHRAPDQVDS